MSISLGQRLSIAGKAITGIFSDDSAKQAQGLLGGILSGSTGDPPYRGASNILAAYSTMPWLRAVSQRVATSVAASTTQWRLYAPKSRERRDVRRIQRAADSKTRRGLIRHHKGLEELESHILLEALNKANSYMVGQSLFKLTQLHLDLVGESFWIKERNAFGAPYEFWPVPPDWIEATPTPENRSYQVSFGAWQGAVPETEILWMADLDPSNPYGRGTGMARSLSDELETDEYAAKHTRQLFFNRARPDMIIWPKSQGAHDVGLQQDQVRRLEERWLDGHQGFWRAFKPFFVGREIQVHEVNQSLQELQLVELRKHERDTIVQVFGIPPELLGILNNSNRATIESADYLFSRWVITPRLEFLRAQLQERLIPEYDDRLVLDFVSPVEEDRAHMLEAAKAAPWAMKVDEWRTLQGQETLDDEAGQVHMMPMNLIPVRTPSVPPAPIPATVAGETPPEGDVITDAWDQTIAVLKRAGDTKELAQAEKESALDRSRLPEIWQELAEQEPSVERMVRLHIQKISKGLDNDQLAKLKTFSELERLIDFEGWIRDLDDAMRPRWKRAYWTGLEFAARKLNITIERGQRKQKQEPAIVPIEPTFDFNTANAAAVNWAETRGGQFVYEISESTKKALRVSLSNALKNGLASEKLAQDILRLEIGLTEQQQEAVAHYGEKLKELDPEISDANLVGAVDDFRQAKIQLRANTIARTELAIATANGREELWREAIKQEVLDVTELRKSWLAASYDVCPICTGLANQESIPFDSYWTEGFRSYQREPAHPNCRCTVVLDVVEG